MYAFSVLKISTNYDAFTEEGISFNEHLEEVSTPAAAPVFDLITISGLIIHPPFQKHTKFRRGEEEEEDPTVRRTHLVFLL